MCSTIIIKYFLNTNGDMTEAVIEIFKNHKPISDENSLWLEFGVWEGRTINYISKQTNNLVYGFDSFKGLPEDWRVGYLKEHFDKNGTPPQVNSNVVLEIGWFNDTLEPFLLNHQGKKITLLHVDCDLYSSSKYVLDKCTPFLSEGSIVIFDELINYDGYEEGEWKAMNEWVVENNVKYEWVGTEPGPSHRQCYSLKILSINK
jgi:hypothetical protein